ncbi:MoaF-related domain-containing protein [Burkholderia gladioli]|uniref:MoaF-related domain-containing protein n=1 Tax=Burkholderia gladioli TaxID=28095 RepID=UPI003F796D91
MEKQIRLREYLLLLILGVVTFWGCVEAKQFAPFGNVYVVSTILNNGDKYKQTWDFNLDGTGMAVDVLEGPHAGLRDNLVLHNMEISPGVWMINWLAISDNAAKGNTISYVVDFNNGRVWGFFTGNSQGDGPRSFSTAVGTIRLKSTAP